MTPAEVPRGSDEAVRRIREESRRRNEQRRGWNALASWCAVATLAGGISLAAMNARQARLQQQADDAAAEALRAHEAAVAEANSARDREHQELCAKLFAGTQRLRWTLAAQLRASPGEKQRARIWAEMSARHAPLASAQAAEGCPVTSLEPEDRPRCRCGDC